jgi:RNA polymerase sigma factor for flagellar operon FliA
MATTKRRNAPAPTSGISVIHTEEELVKANIPLVHYAVAEIAAKIPRHVSRDDLVSAAMAGLAQAARNFDVERGIAFDRYASTRIRGALLDELRSCDWASRSVRSRARQVQNAVEELQASLGRTPTNAEVAKHLGSDVSAVEAVTEDVHRAVVLNYDSMVVDGGAEEILPSDQRSPDAILVERERQSYLHDAIDALPERLKHVVEGYFFQERPMKELADELGVTESRVSQMRAEALELLKDGMNSQLDPEVVVDDDRPTQRIARRKQAYFDAIASNSNYRDRLEANPAQRRGRFGVSEAEAASIAKELKAQKANEDDRKTTIAIA